MKYNPIKIKEALLLNLKDVFENSSNPIIRNLEEGIDWFEKLN